LEGLKLKKASSVVEKDISETPQLIENTEIKSNSTKTIKIKYIL